MIGALRQTYEAHGPITPEWFGSAAKRILGATMPAEKPGRELLAEYQLGQRTVIHVGDYVLVGPSRPGRRDGWKGTVISMFVDKGGPTAEVHHAGDRIHRTVPIDRITRRLRVLEEETT